MEGWFKTHRKLLDSLLWLSEPFTRGQAWVDLIGLATHENQYFYVRGVKVELIRGQVGWSEPKLSERWKWSRTKLRRFLKDLEKEQQIIQHKDNVTQVITIVNYEIYQEKEQQTIQQKNSKRTAEEQQKDAYKNNKNNKNNKNEEIKGKSGFDLSFITPEFESCFTKWLNYKKEIKDSYKTQIGVEQAYKNLIKISGNNKTTAELIINNSIGNEYKGLFQLKETPQFNSPHQPAPR